MDKRRRCDYELFAYLAVVKPPQSTMASVISHPVGRSPQRRIEKACLALPIASV